MKNEQQEINIIQKSILNHIEKIYQNDSIGIEEKSKQIILYLSSFIEDGLCREELYSMCERYPSIFRCEDISLNHCIDRLRYISYDQGCSVEHAIARMVGDSLDYLLMWSRVDFYVKIAGYPQFCEFVDDIGSNVAVGTYRRYTHKQIIEFLTTKLKESGIIHNS